MVRGYAQHSSDRETLLAGGLRVADVAIVVAAGWIAWILRSDAGLFDFASLPSFYIGGFLLGGLLIANVMHMMRAYELDVLREPLRMIARAAGGWLLVMLILVVVSVVTKTSAFYSRIWFGLWFLFGLSALLLVRAAVSAKMAQWKQRGLAGRRVAIVGRGQLAQDVAREMARSPGASVTVVGLIDPPPGVCAPEDPGESRRDDAPAALGPIDRLAALIESHGLQEIVLAVPWHERRVVERTLESVRALPVDVRLAPQRSLGGIPVHGVSTVLGMPMLDLWRRPLSTWDLLVKAAEDRVLSFLILVVAAVPMLLIALAIRLDSPGPVLFRQRRAGFGREPFVMLKFRSMHIDADPPGEVPQARRNDPRVTRVGRFLRRTSLDELPQLINVVRGEMSLVGPRPHAVEHDSLYAGVIGEYLARQRVKPGMTGWAQIHGLRGETDTPEKMRRRVAMDLYYIDNWSLVMDLKILALTPFVVLLQENAY
jgi:putative colanic acid biosynthesis UDP-glucose lipid carrier transferase